MEANRTNQSNFPKFHCLERFNGLVAVHLVLAEVLDVAGEGDVAVHGHGEVGQGAGEGGEELPGVLALRGPALLGHL